MFSYYFLDRTVKVWDLRTGVENLTLTGHPNNVRGVKYSLVHNLLFSVSFTFVKVWDLRVGNESVKSIFTGDQIQTEKSGVQFKTVQMPSGDININDIALGLDDQEFYTAASDRVRVWDIRSMSFAGRLTTPHTAPVMCLTVAQDGRLITGSKDHLISLVDLYNPGQPVSLAPPHYDGVQCLATHGTTLFSGLFLNLNKISFIFK